METGAWLERAARRAPERTAVETPEGSWTYAELLDRARAGAGRLSEMGARPGERVALALPPGLGYVHALHSCLLLGAAVVPVDLRLAAQEREHVGAGALL